jgi:biofilm PGA synthesis N-glycosyltransferase PgaC
VGFWAICFWTCVLLIAHTYVLYPLMLLALNALRPRRVESLPPASLPRVTVVVPLFNEEKVVEAKIRNLESADYPGDHLEILLGSDGSTDGTNAILAAGSWSSRTRFVLFPQRRGKAALLNDLVADASGDVIVFSDANATFGPDTIRKLIGPFRSAAVGAVVGELILDSDRTAGGRGEGLYWRYENLLKRLESNISTTIGAVGPIYAIRRALYRALPTRTAVMDDFVIPVEIIRQGYRVVYEPSALAYERPTNSVTGEFRRKARIGASNIQGLPRFLPVLSPAYGFAAFALWSHKVLRWIVPVLLIAAFVSCAMLARDSLFFAGVLCLQLAFVSLAALGVILEALKIKPGALGLPYYFMATNAALLLGMVRGLRGRQAPTWDIVR